VRLRYFAYAQLPVSKRDWKIATRSQNASRGNVESLPIGERSAAGCMAERQASERRAEWQLSERKLDRAVIEERRQIRVFLRSLGI
jgi:hypothetical protein